jgi:plasmid maintenance system antidote protein VapI
MKLSAWAERFLDGSERMVTEHDILDELTDRVRDESQRAVAAALGLSTPYLNDILHGRRGISITLAERLGWKRVVVFVRHVRS